MAGGALIALPTIAVARYVLFTARQGTAGGAATGPRTG